MPTPPFQQWQSFAPPYAYDPREETEVLKAVNDTERNLTASHASITKDIHQTTLGLRDAIEKGTYLNSNSIERTSGQTVSAVERNGNQLGSAVERGHGVIMTAIEKVAGENRLTTTVTDAASRQASADSARDLAIAIERNGANAVNASQAASGTLLGSIERNAGENRVTTVTSQGFLDTKITDTRHSILNALNSSAAEMHGEVVQSSNILSKAINDTAWETRTALSTGFSGVVVGLEKTKSDLSRQSADYYSSLMLEQQKMGQFLSSKSDNQFAMTQMEILKSKSELASQAAQQFSIAQLEQQKLSALVSAQMAEAKYDALKNTQELGKQIAECCCSLKEKNDEIETNRLRDGLANANNDNNMLKVLEQARQGSGPLGQGILGAYGYPGIGPYGPGQFGGPNYSEGYGNVHVYPEHRGRRHRRSRDCDSRSSSRSRSRWGREADEERHIKSLVINIKPENMSRGSAPAQVAAPVIATEPVAAVEPTIVPEPVPELDPVPTQDNGLPGNDEPVDVIPGQTSD